MNSYLRRAVKYILYLVVVLTILFALLEATGSGGIDRLGAIFTTSRGQILLGAMLVLGLCYPSFGFVKRTLKGDIAADRQKILQAFEQNGYVPTDQADGVLRFRAGSGLKRFMAMYEDAVTVRADDNYIILEGLRKEVVKVEFRLKSLLA